MQKKIVSFFGPGQSSSSKWRRAEDEDDISPGSNSESETDDDNTTRTSRSIATDVPAAYEIDFITYIRQELFGICSTMVLTTGKKLRRDSDTVN